MNHFHAYDWCTLICIVFVMVRHCVEEVRSIGEDVRRNVDDVRRNVEDVRSKCGRRSRPMFWSQNQGYAPSIHLYNLRVQHTNSIDFLTAQISKFSFHWQKLKINPQICTLWAINKRISKFKMLLYPKFIQVYNETSTCILFQVSYKNYRCTSNIFAAQ